MKLSFYCFNTLLGCFLFSFFPNVLLLNANSQESLKINPNKELRNGNFLIGLKQYLGDKDDVFSKNKTITFSTSDNFLNLKSFNGVKHKSKKINILWKSVPLKNPLIIERIVVGPFASYESAKKKANFFKKQGHDAIVAYPENWEVWMPAGTKLSKETNYQLVKKIYRSQIVPFLSNEFSENKLEGPIYITSDEDIYINNKSFGKKFYLGRDSYGTWTLIQKIKFDDYLNGVLPYEIGPNSPLEALKAQAVIARTWALFNSERFSIDQYHLCISTQCQVYKPPRVGYKNVQKAIKDTSNLIITYRNQPINSFYHGSNGGISATASESWEIKDYPYFNTSIDGSETFKKNIKLPITKNSQLKQFLELSNDQFYGNEHSLFRWRKTISNLKVESMLKKNKLIDSNDDLLDFNIIQRGKSGRVIKLGIKTKNSTKQIVLVKDNIRKILSFLPSNLFNIDKLNDNFWIFKGGGFGHGVGLSQSGAIEMAKQGFSYEKILNHYYQKTKIRKIDILSD